MRILITGHKGFIGSALVPYLAQRGHTIYGCDLVDGNDVLGFDFDEKDVDVVIHLAGKSGVRESHNKAIEYWINNVEGTKKIFEQFANTRVIYASSSSAYEPHLNPYAATKYMCELAAVEHRNNIGMRIHTVYSDTPRKGMFMDKLKNGTLKYVTAHTRDFTHIDDVLQAIDIILHNNITGVIDIGSGVATRISDLAPNLPINIMTPTERTHTLADITKLQRYGYQPKHKGVKL